MISISNRCFDFGFLFFDISMFLFDFSKRKIDFRMGRKEKGRFGWIDVLRKEINSEDFIEKLIDIITIFSLFLHPGVKVKTAEGSLELGVGGELTTLGQLIKKIVFVVVAEGNPVFQIVFIFKKKLAVRLRMSLLLCRHINFFFVLGLNLEQQLVAGFYLCCHLAGSHGKFRDRFVPIAGASLATRPLAVMFFVSAVVDNLKGVQKG